MDRFALSLTALATPYNHRIFAADDREQYNKDIHMEQIFPFIRNFNFMALGIQICFTAKKVKFDHQYTHWLLHSLIHLL